MQELLDTLSENYTGLSPQLRLAAKHVMDQPEDIALKSMRSVAADAGVAPATMLRLAQAAGFKSYDAFREPFQQSVRSGSTSFASRTEWLVQLAGEGDTGKLTGSMAEALISNVEGAFRNVDPETLEAAARMLREANRVYVAGFGGMSAVANYFYFVAHMVLPHFVPVGASGGTSIDDLAHIGEGDVLATFSVAPYSRETARALEFAKRRGAKIFAITDSRASPAGAAADVALFASTASPQFFPSQAAVIALIETLIALMVAHGDDKIVGWMDDLERVRAEEGLILKRGEG